MRVLICGGRDYDDYMHFAATMTGIEIERRRIEVVIHGGARGADWCAHLFANCAPKRTEIVFPADWKAHGRAAGPIRNQRMLDEGGPELVVAFPGGKGTADMVRRARKAGVLVVTVADRVRP